MPSSLNKTVHRCGASYAKKDGEHIAVFDPPCSSPHSIVPTVVGVC